MKNAIIIISIVLFVIVVGTLLFLRGNEDNWICVNNQWVKHGNPTAPKPEMGCVDSKAVPTPTVNPSANIILESPKMGDTVGSEFVIKGKARVFENQLNFRVKDAKGNPLIEGTMAAKSKDAGKFGTFEATVTLSTKGKVTIEVFDKSAKDGEEIDKVSIIVTVK